MYVCMYVTGCVCGSGPLGNWVASWRRREADLEPEVKICVMLDIWETVLGSNFRAGGEGIRL